MARQISKIDKQDIYNALNASGMPRAIADLYYFKILKRRNDIVEAFSLSEFEKIDIPDMKEYSVTDEEGNIIVEKGKLKQVSFTGKNVLYHTQENWATFIPKLLAFDLPIKKWTNEKSQQTFDLSLAGLQGLKSEIGVSDQDPPRAITSIPLGVGVQALLSRVVTPNEQFLNSHGEMRIYAVRDRVKFKFSLDSPF